jgi:hypothetical protein
MAGTKGDRACREGAGALTTTGVGVAEDSTVEKGNSVAETAETADKIGANGNSDRALSMNEPNQP